MVERILSMDEVPGSMPGASTRDFFALFSQLPTWIGSPLAPIKRRVKIINVSRLAYVHKLCITMLRAHKCTVTSVVLAGGGQIVRCD